MINNEVSKIAGTNTEEIQEFSALAFARYYVSPMKQFSMFGGASLGYGMSNDKISKTKTNELSLSFHPGISYFLSNHFVIESTIGNFGFNTTKPDNTDATKHFEFGFNLSATSFALQYRF